MTTNTIHVIISGRVQGVGYRAWTVATARTMRVKGWVRNRTNGTVEAIFSGTDEQLAKMIEACYDGPPTARVDAVKQSATQESAGDDFISKQTV
jgi:acylphosphatase